MAGNLEPFTPTIPRFSICWTLREFFEDEEMVGRPNLAQTAKVEQGETDDLKSLQGNVKSTIDGCNSCVIFSALRSDDFVRTWGLRRVGDRCFHLFVRLGCT